MTAQLQAVRDRGTERVAALWESEGAIYGRFGYGLAAWQAHYDIATRETSLPAPAMAEREAGRLRQAVPRDVIERLAEVHDRVRGSRPGMSSRDDRWWRFLTADPRSWRRDTSAQRAVLYEVGDEIHGYARWRVKSGWELTGPNGEVSVTEVVADRVDAYTAVWQFLLSIDLTRTVRFPFAAPDEPLPYLLTNPAALGTSITPGLWIRVVDVPAALAARRYTAPVDLVLEVTDVPLPENAGRRARPSVGRPRAGRVLPRRNLAAHACRGRPRGRDDAGQRRGRVRRLRLGACAGVDRGLLTGRACTAAHWR
jgi:predicted acetyltransferase